MKNLFDNILMLAIIVGGSYAIYHYLVDPPEKKKSAQVRYHENDQSTMFHEREDARSNLDDCYRYANPDSIEGCIEQRNQQQ